MPRVNNLSDAKKPVVTKEPEIAKNDSPLIQSNTPTKLAVGGITLPAFLSTDEQGLPDVPDLSGYLGFAHPQSDNWDKMSQVGLKTGDPFLFHDGSYVNLNGKVEMFLLIGDEFKSLMIGKKGTFLHVTRDMNEQMQYDKRNYLQEHYIVLMLVKVGSELIPIKGDFRGPKSQGLKTAINATKAASEPQWINKTEAHKITAAFPKPFGRVFHTMTTHREVSKSSGDEYHPTSCNSRPSTVSEMEMLVSHFGNPEWLAKVEDAKSNYDMRVQFMDNLCDKTAAYVPPVQS